jgi:hypothetical protein
MTRLARALNSEDLSHLEADCDVDVIQAAGLTAIKKPLGVLIIEAREGCAGDSSGSVARIRDLEVCLERHLQRIAQRWRVRVKLGAVASQVTKELVLDRCSVCQGRGFIPMRYDGQRMVVVAEDTEGTSKDVDCTLCLGSGAARRDYLARARSAGWRDYTERLSEWWEAVLQSCADAEAAARRAMWLRQRKHKT